VSETVCTACRHHIDPAARVCPYCGADPRTGEKVIDTQAMLEEVFRPREISTSETVIEYARQRQGIVIGVSVVVIFLALALLHQFVTARNDAAVSAAPAVPLTEITDLSNQTLGEKPLPIPDLNFQHDGRPQKMQTYIVEAGATAPAETPASPQATQPNTPAKSPQPAVGPQRPRAQ
jgi:hypothetical protein